LCLAAVAGAVLLGGTRLELPGLNYDEVVQAEPAARVVFGEAQPLEIPGARNARAFGHAWPLMTQPYMGALKSWALIPSIAAFGNGAIALRATTLAFALVGIVFALRFARALGGLPLAGAFALISCSDPSLLFTARHDWGSFALGFALRAIALDLGLAALSSGSRARALAAGAAVGLALYNKIDAALFVAAVASAALVAARISAPGSQASAAARGARALLPSFAAGVLAGAAPLLASLGAALAATRTLGEASLRRPEDWAEKLQVLVATLDGSYFERLMRAGGSFERLGEDSVAALPVVPVALIVALPYLLWSARRGLAAPISGAASDDTALRGRTLAFLASAALLAQIAIFLMPRAVRIHHVLGSYPLPGLALAAALALPFQTALTHGAAARAIAGFACGAIVLANAVEIGATQAAIAQSGGKGRWSSALQRYAEELAAAGAAGSPASIVAFDWGLDLPLRYAHRSLAASAPFWALWSDPPASGVARFAGGPSEVYLVYPERYAVFPFGAALLAAARALPPGSAEIREHRDGDGEVAFVSLRFPAPHILIYRTSTGRFEVRLR
jgi:hypothetical protein